jgi:hypothetical protein
MPESIPQIWMQSSVNKRFVSNALEAHLKLGQCARRELYFTSAIAQVERIYH